MRRWRPQPRRPLRWVRPMVVLRGELWLFCLGPRLQEFEKTADAIACYTKIGNKPEAAEAQAGLAALALAQHWIEAILPVLAVQPSAGLTTPFFTYLTCYRVLAANQDSRATAILEQGWRLLQEYAADILEPARQRDFLEAVKVHRELQALYQASGEKGTG